MAGEEVFISYKSEDRVYAVKVRDLLRAAGVSVWVDLEGIKGGQYYVARISQAIKGCKAVVLICTAKALSSPNVQDEIELSRQSKVLLIPLLFEAEVKIPEELSIVFARVQRKKAYGRADDEWMGDLLRALKEIGVPALAEGVRIFGDLPHVLADHFQNRVEELAQLRAHLSDPEIHVMIVSGHRGAGKTALVTRLVQEEAASSVATTVLYLALNESSTVDAIIVLLAAALPGVGLLETWREQSPLVDKLEFLFQQLTSARCWIVLDDFERISTGDSVRPDFEAFIEACLCRDHQTRIIAVSNENPAFPERFESEFGTRKAQVDIEKGLDTQYGIALLRSLRVGEHLGIADTNDEFLGRVVELCSGYPKLLKMLIARVSSQKIETLREFVEDEQGFAQFLDDPVRDVYDNLPAVEREVAQALAIFDDPVNWRAIDYLLDRSAREHLVRLRQRYVVYKCNRGVELHPLYRRYAYEQIPDKDPGGFDRPSLHAKAASYFERQQKVIVTLADVEPYVRMCHQLMRAGRASDAEALLYRKEEEMNQLGFAGPVAAVRTQLMELLTEPKQKGQNLRCLGIALSEMGEHMAALDHYTQSLAVGDAIGDARMQTKALINMGWACNELGFFDRALEHLTEADRRFPEPDRKPEMAGILIGNLADAELNLGRLDSGISRSEEALKLHDGYSAGKVVWLGNLGVAHQNLGDLNRAIAYFKQALAIEEKEKLMRRMRIELCRLGRAYLETGDADSSFDYYQKANQLAAEIADKPSQSRALYGAGTAFHARGDRSAARHHYEAALALGVEKTSHHCLNKLGLLCLQEQKRGEASEHFSRVIAVCEKLIARSSAFEPLYQRAFAYLGSQASAPALADYRQALEKCSARGVVASVLRELRLLQRACDIAGVQEAINLLEQARW